MCGLKYFGNKCRVWGSRFGRNFGGSKNVSKSIGICPETLISHLGIIKIPQNPQKYIQKPRKNKNLPKLFAVFWDLLDPPLLDPVFGNHPPEAGGTVAARPKASRCQDRPQRGTPNRVCWEEFGSHLGEPEAEEPSGRNLNVVRSI